MRSAIIICLLGWVLPCFSQPAYYTFESRSVGEGLSQSTIYSVFQDKEGFIWLGTGDGLNRFDGYNFKIFRHDPKESWSLPGNSIRNITQDHKGRIWISIENAGIRLYDPLSRRFYNFSQATQNLKDNLRLLNDSGDNYWVFDQFHGLYCFHETTGKNEFYPLPEAFVGYNDNSYTTKRGIYLLTLNKLFFFDFARKSFKCLFSISPESHFNALFESGGNLYLSSSQSIYCYDIQRNTIENGVFKAPALNKIAISGIIKDSKGQYWVGTYGKGIFLFDHARKFLIQYTSRPGINSELNDDLVTSLYSDHSGNIWIGTDGGGINMVSGVNNIFNKISVSYRNKYNIRNTFIRSIMVDHSGNIWIGNLKGIDICLRNGGIKSIDLPQEDKENDPIVAFTLNEDKTGVWIGTIGGLYYYLHDQLHRIANGKQPEPVWTSIRRKNGSILFGCNNAMFCAESPGKLKIFSEYYKNVFFIYEDDDSTLWIHDYLKGFCHLTSDGKKEIPLPQIIKNSAVKSCCRINKNLLGLITQSGVYVYNHEKNTISSLEKNQFISGGTVYQIVPDKAGRIWVSSNRGLFYIDLRDTSIQTFSIEDGLQSLEFNSGAFAKSADGTFYWGGINGVNYFKPEEIIPQQINPQVALTGLLINEKEANADSFGLGGTLQLPFNRNNLVLELALLDYSHPQKNRFSYRFARNDENWTSLGSQRTLRLVNLAPGEYNMYVRGTDNLNSWSSKLLHFKFVISSPYYATWWFRSIVLVSLLSMVSGITFLFRRQEFRRRILELEGEREIENIRNRISRDIHDDIGSGLTRISILSESIKSKVNTQSPEIAEALQRISVQSKEIVSHLGEIVWTVNPSNDTLDTLIAFLRIYTGNFLENTSFEYQFDAPDELPIFNLHPEFRHAILMVIKEALNNAVKHSKGNFINVDISIKEHSISIQVKDNGRGIGDRMPDGNGMSSMRNRIEALNGQFNINSSTGKGVIVSVDLPFSIKYSNTTF